MARDGSNNDWTNTNLIYTFFVPRNLDYESLYNHIVTTLTRFVSAPPEDSCTGDNPWWKKPKVAKVNGTAAADASMEEKSQVRPINTFKSQPMRRDCTVKSLDLGRLVRRQFKVH